MDRPKKILCLGSALAALCMGAAASAGEMGAVSKSTVTISLTVAPHLDVRSSAAGSASPSAGSSQKYGFCVSANTPTKEYGVTLATAGEGRGGSSETLPVLEWAGAPDVSNATQIVAGEPVTGFIAAGLDCSADNRVNATLIVRPPSGGAAGRVDSEATLLIVPE